MPTSKPKLLYSASTLAAYRISKKYFRDLHYVWCSPEFGSPPLGGVLTSNPPTSRPFYRYKALQKESQAGDLHSAFIADQKAGLRKGAVEKCKAKLISRKERDEIIAAIEKLSPADFKPLIYVMPFEDVKRIIQSVPVDKRAHPLSEEYIIEALPGDLFDVLNLDEL